MRTIRLFSVFIFFAALFFLLGCGEKASIKTSGDTYSVKEIALSDNAAGKKAQNGGMLLLITLEGAKGDIDDMAEAFFTESGAKSQVSDGLTTADSSFIIYTQDGAGIGCQVAFEVPPSFGPEFTFSGDAFGMASLTLK